MLWLEQNQERKKAVQAKFVLCGDRAICLANMLQEEDLKDSQGCK